jgi:hypothetical protein
VKVLESVSSAVTPSGETDTAKNFDSYQRAGNRPPSLTFQVDDRKDPTVIEVVRPPSEAVWYRVGNFGPRGRFDEGGFDVASPTINLSVDVDRTRGSFPLELYDPEGLLLARGIVPKVRL